ncbi:nuclear migration protein unc-83-like isoform X1 [Haliotis asinina]|uniref:nuclear migration protein unc-83-like isoform X1 n=2 Tax=Haliotis asinina TaxID=109174 RepID=UPI0035320D40
MPVSSPTFRFPMAGMSTSFDNDIRMDAIEKTSTGGKLSRTWSEGNMLRHTRKWTLSYQSVRQQQMKKRKPESVEAKFERYRAWYLSRSPEEELQHLNSTIVGIQRWLRRKQDDLKRVYDNGHEDLEISRLVTIQSILTEAYDQREVVDLVVERGQSYLRQHSNIVLEVDLDNLVYLWDTFSDKLNKLSSHSSLLQGGNHSARRRSFVSETENIERRLFQDKLCPNKPNYGDVEVCYFSDRPRSEGLTRLRLSPRFLDGVKYGSRSVGSRSAGAEVLVERGKENIPPSPGYSRNHDHHETDLNSGSHNTELISKVLGSSNQKRVMEPLQQVELAKGGVFEIHVVTPEKNGKDSVLDTFAELDLPTEAKRRKMNGDTPSSMSSRSVSPSAFDWWDESRSSTPGGSPAPHSLVEFKRKYRKDELWKAIESHYQYLMGKEIIETCRSTESDLSLDDEDFAGNPNVSFAEFLQQYRELTEWLNQIHLVTKRSYMCLSEKYLNQTYHEEMLERSPRRKFFNEYAKQLLLRYPHMKDEIGTRMSFLNNQWQEVEVAIAPKHGCHDKKSMIQDLQCDMSCLRKWLTEVEKKLLIQTVRPEWTREQLQEKLKEHQVLQRDIESQSKVVSAVVKLSQRINNDESFNGDIDTDDDHCTPISSRTATGLERRWHGVWLQSLEWQCRLEEELNNPKGNNGPGFHFNGHFNLSALEESQGSENGSRQDVSSFLGDSEDDSLPYLGGRPEKLTETPHRLDITDRSLSCKLSFLDKSSGDSANISEAESKMEDSLASPDSLELPQSSDGELDPGIRFIYKQENKDIGYSSESYSNDEIELMRLQSLMEDKFPGKCEVASDSPFLSDVTTRGRPKKEYYRMVSVDVDTTDKTDNDDGTDTGNQDVSERAAGSDDLFKVEVTKQILVETTEKYTRWTEKFEIDRHNCNALLQPSQSTSEQSEFENNSETKDKIQYLIDKAEDLVRAGPKVIHTSTPKVHERKTPEKQVRSVGCNTVIISSCDASAEDTDNESSTEEFSTATDEASEKQFDSVICLDYTSDSKNTSRENVALSPINSSPLFENVRLRKQQSGPRRLKDRPWSVVEMQEFSRNLESQPFSTSESAIDRMILSKTDSPSSPPPSFLSQRQAATFPREKKTSREMRRSFSTSEQSSPRGAKRKLRYSSQNDTLLCSRAANMNNLVPSTDSEDDITKHISETDDMVDQFELARVRSSGSSADSDSDTSDAYLTPLVEPLTSDNEDVLNSTGSFSENAWDNYQSPLYPAVSDDPMEEKLHWEPSDEMEFDDDFLLPNNRSAAVSAAAEKKKAKNKIMIPAPAQYDDSDSDIEDFHYVLDQSADQLRLADQSLKKKRKDPMGTGIYLKPAKYAEIMATCVTNIRCLESISQHLDPTDVTMDDCQRMQDILYQWEKLRALASERQSQSTQLAGVYSSINEMKKKHEEIESLMHTDKFSSAQELEAAINLLKEQQRSLQAQRAEVGDLEKAMDMFTEQYPAIPVNKFYVEIADIQETNIELQHSLQQHVSKQEHTLAIWFEYLESCREMDQLLSQDRDRLQKLLRQRDNGIVVLRKDLVNEVETLQSSLSVYESKLSHLQSLRKELHGSSDEDTQTEFLASLADIRNQLLVYEQNCRQIQRNIHDEEDEEVAIEASQLGQLAVSAAALHEHIARSRRESESDEVEATEEAKATSTSSWLSSCPVQVAAVMLLAGIVYLFDPSILQDMANFSIRISPELKYVNGPPPV